MDVEVVVYVNEDATEMIIRVVQGIEDLYAHYILRR